ncbi:hypothetical protein QOZ80_7BG0606090 [Eleusine coracana subsp. coracana]|nr:hypothetical protein QOZ80_7BG0606090 [Eleusine coracana subsp. coracana]
MDMDDCVNLLRNTVRQLHPCHADWIVAYIVSRKTPAEIKQYLLASDDKIRSLITEATSSVVPLAQQFSVLLPAHPPLWRHGLSFPNLQPQVHLSDSSHGFLVPLPIDRIEPLHHGPPQFPPPSNFLGIQAPLPLNVPSRASQSPFSEFIGMEKNFRSLNIAGFQEMHYKRRVHTAESLLMLDKEIRELLFLRQPSKVPIKSLANIYIERYGKPLWIEGSSMEGHQHESVGCSLTYLLLGLKTINVIKRQGQHYIVPVEDAPKYLADEFQLVMPPARNGSKQIYITFAPKSTCTKRDAWNYFSSRYGTVHDVRIIHGERYMFGFVSFMYSETVKRILSEKGPRIPHIICGNQVFVKAYKEKHELEKFAKEDGHSNSGAHKVSYVKVIHENHTETLSAKHQSFWENLNPAHGLGTVTEQGSIEPAPEMASASTHYLKTSSDQSRSQCTELSNSYHLVEASTFQDSDGLRLPESLDDIY